MLCPLCRQRKARRTCPALGQQICAVCCGTKRLVEIQCPETCPYLATAREHPPAVVQREQQRDVAAMMHTMRDVTERQQQLMFLLLGIARRYEGDALQSVVDADLADAARSLASTLETANRGVIYEHQPGTMAAQRLVTDWKALFKDISSREGGDRLLQRDGPMACAPSSAAPRSSDGFCLAASAPICSWSRACCVPAPGEGSPEPPADARNPRD